MDLLPPTDPNPALPNVESSWPSLYASASVQEIEKTKRIKVIVRSSLKSLVKSQTAIQRLRSLSYLWEETFSITASLVSRCTAILDEGREEQDDNEEASFDQCSDFWYDISSWWKFCRNDYEIYEEIYGNMKDPLKRFHVALLVFLEYLAFLLQRILQYFLLFCKFAEFPNRRRPKCTTMPWNIWPSPVVLWGVCWMFYPQSRHQDHTPNEFLLNDEYLPGFHPNLSPDFVLPAFPEGFGQIEDDFGWWNDVNSTDFGEIMGYEAFADSNSGRPEQLNSLDQSFQEDATSLLIANTLVHAASKVTASRHDDAADMIPGLDSSPPLIVVGALELQRNQSLLANSSESNKVNGRFEGALQATVMPFGALPQQIPIPLQTPMAPVQTQNPPQNADEKLSCNHLGCENMQFDRKCDWQTHMNKHTRPFLCEVEEDCPRKTSGFATKDELKRHNEAHKRRNGDNTSVLFYCGELGCPRTAALGNDGFSRKYQLREHIKRAHPGTPLPPDLIPRTAKISKTSNLTELPELMNQSLAVPDTRKRKRTADDNPSTQEASEDGGEDMATPEQKLIKENEMLKRQVQRFLEVIGDYAARDVASGS